MSTATSLQLDIAPLSGTIGAEIRNIDLHGPLDPEALGAVRQALLDYKVIFFPGQHLSPVEHKDFAAAFGPITVAHPVIPGIALRCRLGPRGSPGRKRVRRGGTVVQRTVRAPTARATVGM